MLAALGTLLYTHVLYKRPPITEAAEARRLQDLYVARARPPVSGLIAFDPVTINIAPSPGESGGKPHYATIGFSLEIQDAALGSWVERVRPLIEDKLVSTVARLQFQDLNSVQGRYVLRAKLIEDINRIIARDAGRLAPPPAPAAEDGEGGEGGEKPDGGGSASSAAAEEGGHNPAPASVPGDADDIPTQLVTNVYFSQFIVQ